MAGAALCAVAIGWAAGAAPPRLLRRFVEAGAKGLVLFNRFYRWDIDIESRRLDQAPKTEGRVTGSGSAGWVVISGRPWARAAMPPKKA